MKKVLIVVVVIVVVGVVVWGAMRAGGGGGQAPARVPSGQEIYNQLPPQARESMDEEARKSLENVGGSEERMQELMEEAASKQEGEAAGQSELGERRISDEDLKQIPPQGAGNLPPADKARWYELHGQEMPEE